VLTQGQQVQSWSKSKGYTRRCGMQQRCGVVTQSQTARMQDARPAVVERALDALAEVVVVGGGEFLARRWRADAWPQLARLLREGPAFCRWAQPHGLRMTRSV